MRKMVNLFILAPLAIVLILLSVANRHWVTFSVDPTNIENPAVAIELPFFVFLFISLICGVFIGSCITWVKQGKHRKALREQAFETKKLEREVNIQKNTQPAEAKEIAPGLPMISNTS